MSFINTFLYGSVLKVTRRDTMESIEKCFRDMKANGQDTVVIWPAAFWWEEKTERYPFDTGLKIMDLADRCGMNVIMELAGQLTVCEYIPDFMMKEDYYARDKWGAIEEGQPSFGFLSYFNPEVNDLICRHCAAAAKAYKDCPALIGYDVFNETMFRSYDKYTEAEFRTWLKEKYQTIEALNDVWERTYTDWSQVKFETWMWMSIMPRADHAAFKKASITRFLTKWSDAVRAVDDKHFLIIDNIHSMTSRAGGYNRPQDDFALLDAADEIGMSFYPKQVTGCMDPSERWQIFDGFFAASKREGFLISEMQTHTQAMFNPTTAVRPYELKQWCYEAAAAGAKGIIYWMWRQFDKGLQTLGRGLVDHKGRPTERLVAAKEVRDTLQYGILKPVKSKIGLVYDPLSEDFQRAYTAAYEVDDTIYLASLHGAYKAFGDNNVRCDIITFDEIADYPFIVLSNQVVMTAKIAETLKAYIANGGIVLVNGKFANVDETSQAYFDQPGCGFIEVLGYEWMDTDYEGMNMTFADGKTLDGYYSHEITKVSGEVLARFDNGDAALVQNRYKNGETITAQTDLFYGYAKNDAPSVKAFAAELAAKYDLYPLKANGNLALRLAENETGRYLFAFNYTNDAQSTHITEILGEAVDLTLTVAAQDVLLYKL